MNSEQFNDLYKFVETKASPKDFRALVEELGAVLFKFLHDTGNKKRNQTTDEGGEK